MAYDPSKQYRCTIIRGKAKTDLDNLLPAYARIINDITPSAVDEFNTKFNRALDVLLGGVTKKTLDNHRTEIAYKLFGMFFVENGLVQIGQRTSFFLEKNDQPQFFKDICYRFQQPNGMDSIQTVLDKVNHGIKIKPMAYVLALLDEAKKRSVVLSKREIAYYVLNSLDVLQGTVNPTDVLDAIMADREAGIDNRVHVEGKADSYNLQHINEQLNLLELANLVIISNRQDIILNEGERKAIDTFIASLNEELFFPIGNYNLEVSNERKRFYVEWEKYFSALSENVQDEFTTSANSLGLPASFIGQVSPIGRDSTTVLGDEGEAYIYNYERNRISAFNQRLVNKIKWVGAQRGLGYDIQSILAESRENAEFAKYIEVKSTKRVTAPDPGDDSWQDAVGMTRNEVVAAKQHRNAYFVYRVYFTREAIIVFVIQDPWDKSENNILYLEPIQYRLEFSAKSIDSSF